MAKSNGTDAVHPMKARYPREAGLMK